MRRLGVAAAVVEGVLVPGDVGIAESDGEVEAVGLPPGRAGLAIPGMVDLQVNGYAGVDFLNADAEGWTASARALARDGVTSYVANLVTSPAELTAEGVKVAADVVRRRAPGAARCLGAHLEGPFLAPARRGTHAEEHLRQPDRRFVDQLLAVGPVTGVTLAPELPGAVPLIDWLAGRGLLVSLGHSDASASQAHAGFDAGARTVTHLFNAMPPMSARAPGLAGAALSRPDVTVQVICDGVHLAPENVRLVVAAAGARFVLVTDATAGAAASDGSYALGPLDITVVGGQARNRDGGLAGSVLTMPAALRSAVASGAGVPDAVAAATSRPAALIGDPTIGRLRPGDRADVVVLDEDLSVVRTLVDGASVA